MNILEHPDIKIDMMYVEFFKDSYIYNTNLYCHDKKLTSLKGSPIIINGTFDCHNNQLNNLKHCPKIINDSFYCDYFTLKNTINDHPEYMPIYIKEHLIIKVLYHDSKISRKFDLKIKSLCNLNGSIYIQYN